MADKVLGIDFGATGIKMAEVQNGKDGSTVLRQLFLPLQQDLVHRGAIHADNISRIASELKMFLAANKVMTRDAIMGVGAADDVFVNRTITRWHDPKDFHTAVGFEISANPDLLPGARDGVLLDAVVFGELQDDEGDRKLDALLIGVNPSVVDAQIQVLQKAGLRVAGSDLNAFGLLRSIALPVRAPGQLDLLVDIGHEVLTVILHEGGKPYAVALQKDAGGRAATDKLEQAIQDDDPAILQSAKLNPVGDLAYKAIMEYSFKVYTAISEAIFSYTSHHPEKQNIEGITLTGGGALLRTLPATLQNSFGVPVQVGVMDPAVLGEAERYNTEQKLSACYAAAVGLGMGATV